MHRRRRSHRSPFARSVLVFSLAAACGGRSVSTAWGAGSDGGAGSGGGEPTPTGGTSTGAGGTSVGGSPAQGGFAGASAASGSSNAGNGGNVGGAGGVGGVATAGSSTAGAPAGGSAAVPPVDPALLAGDYDVSLPVPDVDGCTGDVPTHLNLQVDAAPTLLARAFRNYTFRLIDAQRPSFVGANLVLAARGLEGFPEFGVPELELAVGTEGFTGTGFARIVFDCASLPLTVTVPVTLRRDQTAPRLRARPAVSTADARWFAFSASGFQFSEPAVLPSGSYSDFFEDFEEARLFVAFVDADSRLEIPTVWRFSPGGPVAEASFRDLDGLAGRSVTLSLRAGLGDRAGNEALAADERFAIADAAELETSIDFDDGRSAGAHGNAVYYAPNSPDAPCESGACLVLHGAGYWCSSGVPESQSAPAQFAVRLSPTPPYTYRLRYRILYEDSSSTRAGLVAMYGSGCYATFTTPAPVPIDPPILGHTLATPWHDAEVTLCFGPERDRGIVFSLGCETFLPESARNGARLVIERLEVVP